MVYFEYDRAKSKINKDKHGIDFEEARALWKDDDIVEVTSPTSVEPRSMVTGKISGKKYTAVITYRNKNIRIISVRRARGEEVTRYEKSKDYHG